MTRWTNMRSMKARSEARKKGQPMPAVRSDRKRGAEDRPGPPDEGDEEASLIEDLGESALVDQGDGVHVSATRSIRVSRDDVDERSCPSEPPPGWGDG